jgi:TolB-like protein/Flp pilus assembly protein TadD
VLPFDNLSIEPGQDVLADGLATEIHSVLGQMHQVRVASRRSAFSFRNSEKSVKEIARSLNVRYVLSGSLMRAGDRLRIIAELDDAATDTQIWSQKFERNIDDLLKIQTEIAEAIVGAFGIERERAEIARAKAQPTENLDAWSLLQRARNYINDYSEKSLGEARKLLESCTELDSEYAAAHAALGSVLIERVLSGYSDDPPADREKALEAIHKAQQLAPHDHFVLKMAGMVLAACGRPGGALGALRECVKLAPFDFGAWGYFGWPLTARGSEEDLAELNQIMDRLLQAAPDHAGSGYWLYHKSVASVLKNDLEEAKKLLEAAFANHKPVPWAYLHLANIHGLQGNTGKAREAANKATELNPKLSVEHYAECIQAMTADNEASEVRLAGLKQAGLLS